MINSNLIKGKSSRDFYVWVDPDNFLIRHQVGTIGSFLSVSPELSLDNLLFVPNPAFKGFISPFQNNLVINFRTEYNLEMSRRTYFKEFPSRLEAIFLLETEDEAHKYKDRHIGHVGKRLLKKVRTVGDYTYSLHDSSWVDFHRIGHAWMNRLSTSFQEHIGVGNM